MLHMRENFRCLIIEGTLVSKVRYTRNFYFLFWRRCESAITI